PISGSGHAPDRILYPMRRTGPKGSGQFERISWDDALAEIRDRWTAIIDRFGAEAILPYTYSGTLGLIELSVAATRFWGRLGSSQSVGDLCDGAGNAALDATFGGAYGPDPRHVLDSKLVLIWAHNPASTSPHFMPLLREAQRNGAKVVVIDPRRSKTARSADLFIPIKPGTDAAMALAMMNVIFSEGLNDETWLEANTVGWRELRERAAEYPLERAEAITGVPAETIRDLAIEYASTKPALLKIAPAINRHEHGGQTVRSLLCLAAVAGQIGIRCGCVFEFTGSQIRFNYEAVTHASEYPTTGREINMIRLGATLNGEVQDPPIMSLFVFNCNPVASAPDSATIVQGLLREDLFTVVHELFMTDTALYADLILPAVTQLERVDLHKPYGHLHLQYNQQAIAPLGEAVSNWDLMRKLATTMGFTEPWLHQTAEEIIDEIVTATVPANPNLAGLTPEMLREQGTFAYLNHDEPPHADGSFATASGKMELASSVFAEAGLDPLPTWTPASAYEADRPGGLIVLSAAPHHFVTTSMGNQPGLLRKEGDPHLEIHPEDAAERGIAEGDILFVENERGNCLLRAVVTPDIARGVTICPKGHWARLSPGGRTINWLIGNGQTDIGMQAVYHSTLIWVRSAEPHELSDAVAAPELALAGD
ncbi:MAG: molybdopterin-dependent oxidoreductase, partial [Chloroflexota bacterium]|nr:molybdopterin-dependent oxidoreductase [Chloroflexota bacterium]